MEKKITVLSWEIAHENDLVRECLEYIESDDVVDCFVGDPDILYVEGDKILFIVFYNEDKTEKVAVYLDPEYGVDENIIERRLKLFLQDDFRKYYNDYDGDMNEMKNGIAFRDGQGYYYALWEWKKLYDYENISVEINEINKTVVAIYYGDIVGEAKYEHIDELKDFWFTIKVDNEIYDINTIYMVSDNYKNPINFADLYEVIGGKVNWDEWIRLKNKPIIINK